MVEEDRVVCIRFGHDHNEDCMAMDETLYGVSEKVQNFAVIYLGKSVRVLQLRPLAGRRCRPMRPWAGRPVYAVGLTNSRYHRGAGLQQGWMLSWRWVCRADAEQMYELYDNCTLMFFYR